MKRCPKCPEVYSDMMHFCPNDGSQLVPIVAQDPLINNTIDGKYVIEAVIGKGGMGVVYRARHTNFNRKFAIKVLKSELVNDPQAVKRFRNEANAAGAIRHPNAIAITDFNITPDGLAYLVMDYVEGRSLRETLKKEGALSYLRTIKLISQVCDAVAAAHRKGIIHRDLKPDNIMVETPEDDPENEIVHVLDFGIAKLSQNPAYSENITVGGAILGSPYYMSPEQCDGRQLDLRSDIYSIGIILYEMVTGKVPFRAQTPWGLVKMHCSATPQPPSKHRPDIVPLLEKTILKALLKDPNDRQQSAMELKRELEAILGSDTSFGVRSSSSPGFYAGNLAEAPPPPKSKAEASTAPLDESLAKKVAESFTGEELSKSDEISSATSLVGNLKTTPMPAIEPENTKSSTGSSQEQKELEELARQLEAEMQQFKSRKGSTENRPKAKIKRPLTVNQNSSTSMDSLANELARELERMNSELASKPSPSSPFPAVPQFMPPSTTPAVAPSQSSAPPLSAVQTPPENQLSKQVVTQYSSGQVTSYGEAQTSEIYDIAEEFSLALPEMVEDLMLSVSETIHFKADLLFKQPTQQATSQKMPSHSGVKSSPNVSFDRSIADRSELPSKAQNQQIAQKKALEETEKFKKKLLAIVITAIGLILIISGILYVLRSRKAAPPQPVSSLSKKLEPSKYSSLTQSRSDL
ncbi:MAG: serine/threonine protein kinase [Blastocatellia bacterium]|nr:serine/threonine protein kinase [Blastocatellia bacterium]